MAATAQRSEDTAASIVSLNIMMIDLVGSRHFFFIELLFLNIYLQFKI
jgi:hypothetical protein